MNIALQSFCCLIAAEFAYIFYLETVIPDSGTTAKVFGMDVKDLKMPAMKPAMKNQGVYNLGIAVRYIDADTAEGMKAAAKHGVRACPTVIMYNESEKELSRAYSVADLKAHRLIPYTAEAVIA